MEQSILSDLLAEVATAGNYGTSEKRSRILVSEIENLLDKRTVFYFASEVGTDQGSWVTDEDAFVIENLLSVPQEKKDLVLVLHSGGGQAIAAERIIDVCRSYCKKRSPDDQFYVLVPKKAKSAATILALGAHKVFLRETAELGPVDPQMSIADEQGNTRFIPAYLQIDAIENLIASNPVLSYKNIKSLFEGNGKALSELPREAKIKLFEQCNYAIYVSSKNELGLSDSIIEKIAREKKRTNDKIQEQDFDIFRDPHLTKSHGRLINLKDLRENSLSKEGIINSIESIIPDTKKVDILDNLLWELYVRKRRLLNDGGNGIVKTIETSNEYFSISGKKSS